MWLIIAGLVSGINSQTNSQSNSQSNSQPVEKKMLLKNEIYASYGFGSSQELVTALADVFEAMFSFTDGDFKVTGIGGPVQLGYKRVIDDYLGIGLMASYTHFNSEYLKKSDKSVLFTTNNFFWAVMVKLDFYYVINEWVQMYSGGSFGVINCDRTQRIPNDPKPYNLNETLPSYQLNLFSLRAGKSIGGYFELGFGTNGIINLGVSYKF
jgi:opacity protein-like surface antigen